MNRPSAIPASPPSLDLRGSPFEAVGSLAAVLDGHGGTQTALVVEDHVAVDVAAVDLDERVTTAHVVAGLRPDDCEVRFGAEAPSSASSWSRACTSACSATTLRELLAAPRPS
jgi:hypothetical protein